MAEQLGSQGTVWQLELETTGEGEIVYPPDVDARTFDFLLSAASVGALKHVSDRQRNMLEIYYLTTVTIESIPTQGQREKALLLLRTAFNTLWERAPSDLQKQFPAKELRMLKDADDPEIVAKKLAAQKRREENVERIRKRWEDPEYRKRVSGAISAGVKKKWQDPEYRSRVSGPQISEARKRSWNKPGVRERASQQRQNAWKNPTTRKNIMAGKEKAEKTDYQARAAETRRQKWQDPEFKAFMQERMRIAYADPELRARRSQTTSRLWQDPEYRERMSQARSETMKKRWEDPDYRAYMASKQSSRKTHSTDRVAEIEADSPN